MLDNEETQRFVNGIEAEGCISFSRNFLTHSRGYFISVHKGDGRIHKFAVEAPGAVDDTPLGPITYVDEGRHRDGATKTGTFIYKAGGDTSSCRKLLSEYVGIIETAQINLADR